MNDINQITDSNFKKTIAFFGICTVAIVFLMLVGFPIVMPIQDETNNPKEKSMEKITTKCDIPQVGPAITAKDPKDMNCTELNDFITSFEKGWGNAMALYNERCETP